MFSALGKSWTWFSSLIFFLLGLLFSSACARWSDLQNALHKWRTSFCSWNLRNLKLGSYHAFSETLACQIHVSAFYGWPFSARLIWCIITSSEWDADVVSLFPYIFWCFCMCLSEQSFEIGRCIWYCAELRFLSEVLWQTLPVVQFLFNSRNITLPYFSMLHLIYKVNIWD